MSSCVGATAAPDGVRTHSRAAPSVQLALASQGQILAEAPVGETLIVLAGGGGEGGGGEGGGGRGGGGEGGGGVGGGG